MTYLRTMSVIAIVWVLGAAAASYGAVDYNVEGDALVQNEISLTYVPGTSGGLAMAYNDNPYNFASCAGLGIAYRLSAAGAWSTAQINLPATPAPGNPKMDRAFDPTITADSSGNLYAGFIGDGAVWGSGASDSGMYVAKSTDGGQNWGAAVQVAHDGPPVSNPDPAYRFNDRCQITVGVDPQTSTENVYVAWIKDRGYNQPSPWSDVYFSRSTDGGLNYSTAIQINQTANNMGNMPVPTVAANGHVYVSWMDYNVTTGGTGQVYIRKSTDGGQTFPQWDAVNPDHPVVSISLPPLQVFRADGTTDALAKGAPVLAAHPSTANELYMVYAADPDGLGGDDANIYFIKSTDGGQSWSPTPLKVNDDSTSCDQIMPWIDVKSDGTIDVAWYDRRDDANDAAWHVYIAKSTNGGTSFSTNVLISDSSAITPMFTVNPPYGGWMGEYLGLATDGTNAYLAWCSSLADSNGDIYFDSIPNSSIPEPCTLALAALGGAMLLRRRSKHRR